MTPILSAFAFLYPLLVLPGILDNAFNTPKTVLALLTVCILWGWWSFKPRMPKGEIPVILGVIFVLCLGSSLYTANPYYTQHATVLYGIALSLVFFASMANPRPILAAMAASGVLVALETWLQFAGVFLLFPWAKNHGTMVMGTIGNSNYLGAYLLFPIFSLAFWFREFRGWRRILTGMAFLFVFVALLMSRARGAWVGMAVGLPLFLWLSGARLRATRKTVAVALVALCLGLWGWNLAPSKFTEMIKGATNSTSMHLRTKYLAGSWRLYLDSPAFGTGLWSYRNQVFDAQARIEKASPGFFRDYPEPKPESAHCEYLEVLNDGGLVAGVVLLWFLVTLFRHYRRGPVSTVALCAIVAILVDAAFFFPLRVNSTLFSVALMVGILEGRWQESC